MEFFVAFAFVIIMAILFNYGWPKWSGSKYGLKLGKNFAGQTLSLALFFFVMIYVLAYLFHVVHEKPNLTPGV